jgi:hypothetical protein
MPNLYEAGSEWRRWDLHIHTPESVLNNGFGSDWDAYVQKSAAENTLYLPKNHQVTALVSPSFQEIEHHFFSRPKIRCFRDD